MDRECAVEAANRGVQQPGRAESALHRRRVGEAGMEANTGCRFSRATKA